MMVGYSDSAKDAGRFNATWALCCAQEQVVAACARHGVCLTLFHGRGGSVGAVAARRTARFGRNPPGSIRGRLRRPSRARRSRHNSACPISLCVPWRSIRRPRSKRRSGRRHSPQPRQPVAAAGAADADRHVVADQSPAAPRQDRWAAGQARAVLLAVAGGESSDPTPVRGNPSADLGAARADRLTGDGCHGVRLDEERTQHGSGVRDMSSGTRRRTDAGPSGGCHHGAITATENVEPSAASLAYHAADQ
jgi:hypothetical protein